MLRKFSLVTAFMACIVYAQAQGIKFGVHVDPLVSLMASNDKKVVPDGANFGFGFGVEMEYYFSENENYAFTFGANFAFGKGGKLAYAAGGRLLRNSELTAPSFFRKDSLGIASNPASGTDLPLVPGTTIRYSVNYLEVPFGLKLRTNELGQSYMRAFFHLPTATIAIPVSARATVDAPVSATHLIPGYYTTEPSKGENIYKDIIPLQFLLGVGAGVEYAPNEEAGLRITGGFYYNYGFLDILKKNELFDNTTDPVNPTYRENKARTGFHNIGLRVGVIF